MKIGKSTQDTISSIAMIVGTWLLLAGAGYLLRLLLLYFFVIFAFAVTIVMLLLYIILAMMMMPMDDGFWQWPLEMWSEMTPMTAWYIWLLLSGIVALALVIWVTSQDTNNYVERKIEYSVSRNDGITLHRHDNFNQYHSEYKNSLSEYYRKHYGETLSAENRRDRDSLRLCKIKLQLEDSIKQQKRFLNNRQVTLNEAIENIKRLVEKSDKASQSVIDRCHIDIKYWLMS